MGISDFLGIGSDTGAAKANNRRAMKAANQGQEEARGAYDQAKGEAFSIYDQGIGAADQLTQAGQPATDLYNQLVGGGEGANTAFQNSQDYRNMLDATSAGAEDLARFGAGRGNLFSGNMLIDLADNQQKHRQGALNDLYSHLNPGMNMYSQGQQGRGNLYAQKAGVPMDWGRLTGQSFIGAGENKANMFMANNAADSAAAQQDAALWQGLLGFGSQALGMFA